MLPASDEHRAAITIAAKIAALNAEFEIHGALAASPAPVGIPARVGHLRKGIELALRSIVLTWGGLMAKPMKLWEAFDSIAEDLDQGLVDWMFDIRRPNLPDRIDDVLPLAVQRLRQLLALADGPPPASWTDVPRLRALEWNDLPSEARAFLVAAKKAAEEFVPGLEVWLFGSRATGTAAPASDYDVMLVLPDSTPESLRGIAMGQVWSAARTAGVTVDHQFALASKWTSPSSLEEGDDHLLFYEVRACGVRVPGASASRTPV